MRIMGLDLGESWTGVAFSDPTETVAIPTTVLDTRNEAAFLSQLVDLVEQNQVERVVVGLPLSMDGHPRRQARWAKGMQKKIADYLALPVDTFDERLSTAGAQNQLRDSGVKRKDMCLVENSTAAAFILQGYLNKRKMQRQRS
jgi:putative Holliday junction resolvase